MRTTGFLAVASSLAALALAAPLEKRAATTTTVEFVTTILTTTTIWINPTATPDLIGVFAESYASVATTSSTTSSPEVEAPAPAPITSTPVAAVVYSPAPVPTSSAAAAVVVVAAVPSSSKAAAAAAPAATTTAAAAKAAAPSTVSNAASGSASYPYSGDMTFYDVSVGLGSCGKSGSNSENLVALAKGTMANGINPNNNPKCGKTIEISYGGNVQRATVFDTCPECADGSIDVPQQLFDKIAPSGNGRVHDVSWRFVD